MHLTFQSDTFITGNGFSLTYEVAGVSQELIPQQLQNTKYLLTFTDFACLHGHVCFCVCNLQDVAGYMSRLMVT